MIHLTDWSKKAAIMMVLKGLSTKDLANEMGWSQVYTAGFVSGRNINPEPLNRLSDHLGITNTNTLDDLPELIMRELKRQEHRK